MDNCLNCNHPLKPEDKFCAQCSQKVGNTRLPFWAGLSDFFINAFSFDSKVFLSLRQLLLKPGLITQQYNAGMQARFVPPLRMYLTITLIFFLITSLLTKLGEKDPWETYNKEQSQGEGALEIQEVDSTDEDMTINIAGGNYDKWAVWIRSHPNMAPEIALDSLGQKVTSWNKFIYAQIYKVALFEREEFNDYLESKTQLLIFLFLPLIALVLKWVYIRHRIFYFEHLVFALHLQSVFFILLTLQVIFDYFLGTDTLGLVVVLFALYLLLAMKRVYDQSWKKTSLKFILTNTLGIGTLLVFGGLMFLLLFVLF